MVKRDVVFSFPALFLSLLLTACTSAPANPDTNILTELKNLCTGGDHEACIRRGEAALSAYDENGDAAHIDAVAEIHKMLSEAAERSGDADGAGAHWADLLETYGPHLTDSRKARIRLNMAAILKRAGRYTDALAAYGEIERRYGDTFPESYARYAREAAGSIESARVARITGKATCRNGARNGGITITAFNGFEESRTETDLSGSYELPLYASTPGTRYCLFVYREGYEPEIILKSFDGSGAIGQGDVVLAPANPEASGDGMVMGIVYSAVRGGKVISVHGIRGTKQQAITLMEESGENRITITSDENGFYRKRLSPGAYLLRTSGIEKKVSVKSGHFYINNFASGTYRID